MKDSRINKNENSEKRRISLERADELYAEIEDYLQFKDEFMRETEERRDVMSRKHKDELMEYFDASEADWNDWHWQLKNRISSVSLLSKFIKLSDSQVDMFTEISKKYRWATTPYYLSLMDYEDMKYPINMMALPTAMENDMSGEMDPMGEEYTNPAPCITRRYPNRLIINVTSSCAMFCRHCQRRRCIGETDRIESEENISAAIEYIKNTREIRDVLITGGDPMMLPDELLESIIKRVREIPHVEIIRIGTRVPVTMPQRITRELVNMLKKYHPLFINTQFNHPGELTEDAVRACSMLSDAGIPLGNQMVFLKGINNDKYIVQLLNEGLLKARVRPYYIFHPKQVRGTRHFQIKVEEGLKIMKYLRGHTSGLAIPQYILNAPHGYGKIPLLPNYIEESDDEHVKLRTWENREVEVDY
ncbi:MAG: KamA family radical SAM protein [Lachnospiraceae bacterium]|nr:KamA family radical SAM protein [Lachnospiraceae bacterium]